MRRVGKIGRQKVFPKVKNVNVESLKIGSKLLDFGAARRSDEEARRSDEEAGKNDEEARRSDGEAGRR